MLIITGTLGERLHALNDSLHDAGASSPRELAHAVLPTVQVWLDQFMAQVAPEERQNPGRIWELAAGELMLANVSQALWTWADPRHLGLLDFWRKLAPSARFLLLQVDPARYLAEFCHANNSASEMELALLHWEEATAQMLAFHLEHREISRMTLLHTWQTDPHSTLRALATFVSLAPGTPRLRLPETDAELLWLCEQWIKSHPRAQQLWLEVQACCPSSPPAMPLDLPSTGQPSPLDNAIRACVGRMLALEQQAQLLTHSTLAHEETARQVATLTEALTNMRERAEAVEAAQIAESRHDAEMNGAVPAVEIVTARRAASEAQTEARWLRAQLHQVQEELEHTYLLQQSLQDEHVALAAAHQRLINRHPDALDFHRAEIIPRSPGVLTVQFLHLAVGRQVLPVLEVLLIASKGGGSLILPSGQSGAAWIGDEGTPPLVISSEQTPESPADPRLAKLSATQWRLIRALPAAIKRCLSERNFDDAPWETPLSALDTHLRAPEHLWRWDAVTLLNEQVNADYEHLWICLEAASFNGRHWPRLGFRVSAAEVITRQFSGHFKYEIPTQSEAPQLFEHWQPDVADEWGERFELRFNLAAGALDVAAWNQLSRADHHRLVGLMVQLPEMIATLGAANISISRPWQDWLELNTEAIRLLLKFVGA